VKATKLAGVVVAALSTALLAGCGEVARTGASPAQPVIVRLEAAPGEVPDQFGGTLLSDVDGGDGSVINDIGRVTMTAILKDQGFAAASTPSRLNQITFTRYRVVYERADGRNQPGVDVPYAIDSAATFTVAVGSETSAAFDIVRHNAKREAPLATLAFAATKITTIAHVTFYGSDLAGNDVAITGQIGITFGQFVRQ
jgi:hypothetical protein